MNSNYVLYQIVRLQSVVRLVVIAVISVVIPVVSSVLRYYFSCIKQLIHAVFKDMFCKQNTYRIERAVFVALFTYLINCKKTEVKNG